MKYSEIHRKLLEAGCYLYRNGKKHPIWYSPIAMELFETSNHDSQEAKNGTAKSIAKKSGV